MAPNNVGLGHLPRKLRDSIYRYHITATATGLFERNLKGSNAKQLAIKPYTILLASKQIKGEYLEACRKNAIRHFIRHIESGKDSVCNFGPLPTVDDRDSIVLHLDILAAHAAYSYEKDGYLRWERQFVPPPPGYRTLMAAELPQYTNMKSVFVEIRSHTHGNVPAARGARAQYLVWKPERAIVEEMQRMPQSQAYSVRVHGGLEPWGVRESPGDAWKDCFAPHNREAGFREHGELIHSAGLGQVVIQRKEEEEEQVWVGKRRNKRPALPLARVFVDRNNMAAEEVYVQARRQEIAANAVVAARLRPWESVWRRQGDILDERTQRTSNRSNHSTRSTGSEEHNHGL